MNVWVSRTHGIKFSNLEKNSKGTIAFSWVQPYFQLPSFPSPASGKRRSSAGEMRTGKKDCMKGKPREGEPSWPSWRTPYPSKKPTAKRQRAGDAVRGREALRPLPQPELPGGFSRASGSCPRLARGSVLCPDWLPGGAGRGGQSGPERARGEGGGGQKGRGRAGGRRSVWGAAARPSATFWQPPARLGAGGAGARESIFESRSFGGLQVGLGDVTQSVIAYLLR